MAPTKKYSFAYDTQKVGVDCAGMTGDQEATYHRIMRLLWIEGPQPAEVLTARAMGHWQGIAHCFAEYEDGLSIAWLEECRTGRARRTPKPKVPLTLGERQKAFIEACRAEVEKDPTRLHKDERREFFEYWTEEGKNGKMRFEDQKFFSYGRRMDRWMKNLLERSTK